jgi:hypothetical protein
LQDNRGSVTRACRVGGPNGEPVNAGAVEWRHVDRRREIVSEHTTERLLKLHGFAAKRLRTKRIEKTLPCFVSRQNREELLLPQGLRGEELRWRLIHSGAFSRGHGP